MSVELSDSPVIASQTPTMVQSELRCALTGQVIAPGEAYWAQPLITARQLITTVMTTTMRTPSNLGHVLFDEMPNVPYAQEAREELAARRTAEQLKLLVLMLLIAAVIITPVVMLTMG